MSNAATKNGEEEFPYWFTKCESRSKRYNGRTEFEVMRDSLRDIHTEKPNLFPKKPEIVGVSGIKFLTSEANMRSAAEHIRSKVYFPFCLFGRSLKESFPDYLHTFGGEFYKWHDHGWKLDQLGTPKNSLEADESRLSLIQSCSVSKALNKVLPSQVPDKEFVYFPSSEEAIKKMKQDKGGKWMLHSPGCMNVHDSYWLKLVKLCQEGFLIGVKASTAMVKECDEYDVPGFCRKDPVIMCYTADCRDRFQVGRAADAIREVVKSEYVLYYKTNSASNSGRYYHEGSSKVSKFLHTVEGEMYERDQMQRWKRVDY